MSDGEFTTREITDSAVIIDTAIRSADPKPLDANAPQALVIPEGARVEIPDLSAWRDAPTRKTGTYQPATVAALTAYVERHTDPETSTVWVHPTSGRVEAVLDDNSQETPGWRQHKAVLQLEHTPEWNHWTVRDGQMMSQEDFAEHIEVGLDDIAEPEGATVLEIAQTFHATNRANFRQATRLNSGEVQFQYDEELKATAGAKGELSIPATIMLAVSPFVGEDPYKVVARLRYRLSSGTLSLGYKLDRPDAVKRDALEAIAERLAAKFPLTYVGSAPTT